MTTIKTNIILCAFSLFLVTGAAQALDTEGLDVTITTMDADDQANDVSHDLQLPKEDEDSKDEHANAGSSDQAHEQEGVEDEDHAKNSDSEEKSEMEDSKDSMEASHEDSHEEQSELPEQPEQPEAPESSSTM